MDQNVIYLCNLKSDSLSDGVNYIGVNENTFKDRLYKHRNSFKYESKVNSTELSKSVWEIKKSGVAEPEMKWSVCERC